MCWEYWWSKNNGNNFNGVALSWAWKSVCMFLHNLCYLGCNSLSNQHWIWCIYWLVSLVLKKRCYSYYAWQAYSMELRSNNNLMNLYMGKVKQIEIKNQAYFYKDIMNIEEFDSNLYKDIDIYYTGYITIKKNDDCENIYSVNPFL